MHHLLPDRYIMWRHGWFNSSWGKTSPKDVAAADPEHMGIALKELSSFI